MAEAKFVSGRLKIAVSYIDRTNEYKVKLCPVVKGERCDTQYVGAPAAGSRSVHGKRLAVDDPRAFRQAAGAAISFSNEDIQSYADYGSRQAGWRIRPPRRRNRR